MFLIELVCNFAINKATSTFQIVIILRLFYFLFLFFFLQPGLLNLTKFYIQGDLNLLLQNMILS